jgi:hypothetical protein
VFEVLLTLCIKTVLFLFVVQHCQAIPAIHILTIQAASLSKALL